MGQAGAVASWLARSTTDRAVWVRALAGIIVLSSLHPGVQIGTSEFIAEVHRPSDGLASHPRRSARVNKL